jgi:hypothetical protein
MAPVLIFADVSVADYCAVLARELYWARVASREAKKEHRRLYAVAAENCGNIKSGTCCLKHGEYCMGDACLAAQDAWHKYHAAATKAGAILRKVLTVGRKLHDTEN